MKKLKFNKSGLAISRRVAAEGSVLLKNENVLPLKKTPKLLSLAEIKSTLIKVAAVPLIFGQSNAKTMPMD